MPGGFHPFHPGHKSLYDWAVETFGKDNVYVAATNDTKSRPFPFDVKIKLAQMAGVPANRFIQVKSPFNALSYNDIISDASQTALVFVRSEKDKTSHPLPDQVRKSDGNMGYLISYNDGELETADTHGYLAYGPTIDFDFSGMSIKSASELRAAWPEMSDEDKLQAAELMYPGNAQTATQLLNKALGDPEAPVSENVAENSNNIFARIKQKMIDNGIDPKRAEELIMADYAKKSQEMSRSELRQYYEKLGLIPDEKTRMSQRSWLGSGPDYSDDSLNDLFKNEDVSPKDEDKFHNELDDLVHKYFGDSPDEEKMLKKYKKTDEEAPPGREDQVKALKKEFPDDEGAPYAIAWAQHNKKKKKTNESESATYYIVTVHSGGTIKRYKFDGDKFADSNEAADFVTKIFDKKGISVRVKATQYRKKESVSESDVVIDPTQLRQYLRMLIDDAIDKEQDIDKLSKVLKILVGKEIKSRGKRYKITSEDIVNAFEASCKNRKKKMREASNPNLERAIALAMGAQNLLQGSLTGGDEMDTTVILSPSAKKKANQMITQAQKLSGLSVEKLIDLGQRQLDKDSADVSAEFNEERSEELPDGSTKDYAADGSYTHSGAWGKKFYDANGKLIKTQTPVVNGLSTIKYADGKARYIFSGGGLESRGPLEGNKPGEADYLSYSFGGARFIFDARKGQPVIKGSITIGRLKVALTGKVLDRPAFHKNPRTMMTQILGGDPLAILKDPMAVKPLLDKGTAKIYLDGKEVGAEQLAQAVEQGL